MQAGDADPDPGRERRLNGQRRARLIRAIDHSLRRRILRLLLDEGQQRSPVQMSKALAVPLGSASYHVRVLHQLHAVKPSGRRQVRGALQRFYETTIEDDPPIETLLEETREIDEADT
jgi:DNA-binding transcriptional ArsR family regulator